MQEGIICDDSVAVVRKHYVSTLFLLDLLCTFPFALCVLPVGSVAFRIGSTFRLLRPFRATRLLQWSNSLHSMPRGMYLLRTLFLVGMLTNVLTCASIFLYRWHEPHVETNPIGNTEDMVATYEQALYWMVSPYAWTVCLQL